MRVFDYGDENGELVSRADYQQLESENAALRVQLEMIRLETSGLTDYIQRNKLNFQLEKAMDWINRLKILSDGEGTA